MKPENLIERSAAMVLASFFMLASASYALAEEYLLQPGDVLSVMIVGPVGLEQTVPVEMDGTAWFPVIGEVNVADTSLRTVRETVARAYSVTSLPAATGPEGVPQLIQASQVHVGVSDYLPVYVSGIGLQPRTIDFRPGLTLRKALLLSAVVDDTGSDARLVAARHAATTLDLARAYARIWSLKSFLGTDTREDYQNIFVTTTTEVKDIVELERALIAARREDLERRRQTVANNMHRANMRLDAVTKQRASEAEGLALDEKIVADLRSLASKGLTNASRLAEVRRTAISSAGSVLQLDAAIEDIRSDLTQLEADAGSIELEQRTDAWRELSETIATVRQLRADLVEFEAAQAAADIARTDLIAVITRRGKLLDTVDLTETDPALYPGDLVEIKMSETKGTDS